MPNLTVDEGSVEDLMVETIEMNKKIVKGVVVLDSNGSTKQISSSKVVLTTGTFLGGVIYIGTKSFPAGRIGESPTIALASTLKNLGFATSRLRTGTPPRLAKDSINYETLLGLLHFPWLF